MDQSRLSLDSSTVSSPKQQEGERLVILGRLSTSDGGQSTSLRWNMGQTSAITCRISDERCTLIRKVRHPHLHRVQTSGPRYKSRSIKVNDTIANKTTFSDAYQ